MFHLEMIIVWFEGKLILFSSISPKFNQYNVPTLCNGCFCIDTDPRLGESLSREDQIWYASVVAWMCLIGVALVSKRVS